jgi:CBS domain-containing protein
MFVRDGMTDVVLSVGPGHSLHEAAAMMCSRNVGAAVVIDPDAPGPGVVTERDILHAVGAGQDPAQELVADHLKQNLTFAHPGWSLEQAAQAMIRGGFRHLIVIDGSEPVGILSMRDIVRAWTEDGASCDVSARAAGATSA